MDLTLTDEQQLLVENVRELMQRENWEAYFAECDKSHQYPQRWVKALCDLGFDLIGVNSRDLRTFEVHPELLLELAATAPTNVTLVAESGLRTAEDIATLRDAGYQAFLIGESLMRQPDPAQALAHLLHRAYAPQHEQESQAR